ncbi:3-hydroxyacyl-ACP dehydratase FabZ [Afifella marina]|uniref:3-hydroxyacyl-[acyl-carrier-protein] dehydratase FabZ n=1 Tax=Afifella marina DSM 2698 TaxID=1120955 RepID=A0A1G5NJM6_AFIMA|nr:3-hydroxyacyl-ACP dehydratase FabZ [Afifella marina]MBK1623665.1 3-hydroxyacyl-[acyl-carrier-protein] dehydratase FabZ [Afifella marina DSM 2698]MBK1626658.1 3-hydroxyacyl-[acyl-carrier-protein] dehydratase FabZ [Afifella marina]MBK5916207.1 3-hydroxyacyl-[acyl-carrier-protein] dehydratase FabZ [Afifella marina]RAI21596.1 3-hydroxyacyl-[acyl-carrier-protein] dehydratase FabZ [Afifella marina DSM 2698]SCZ37597.1 3-hydroxyacyl-[acyl-carrier-protein] dehydratase [Afifella marina DSM 2698]
MNEMPTQLEATDIHGILQALPHRYPFLMVDRIRDIRGDESGVGIKNVTMNEPHFQGHFPGFPIMPGVLLIEGMAQTAAALCVLSSETKAPKRVFFMTIDKAKFRHPVTPGDTVEYHVNKLKRRGTIWKYAAVAEVAGKKVAEAQVSAMVLDE